MLGTMKSYSWNKEVREKKKRKWEWIFSHIWKSSHLSLIWESIRERHFNIVTGQNKLRTSFQNCFISLQTYFLFFWFRSFSHTFSCSTHFLGLLTYYLVFYLLPSAYTFTYFEHLHYQKLERDVLLSFYSPP